MSQRILFVLTSHDRKGRLTPPTRRPAASISPRSRIRIGYSPMPATPWISSAPRAARRMLTALIWTIRSMPRSGTMQPCAAPLKPHWRRPRSMPTPTAVFYAGGHATMWDFPDSTELAAIAARIYERGGIVAAVCHGPAGLVNLKLSNGRHLVEGKDVSAFTNDEERAVGLYDTVPFLLAEAMLPLLAQRVSA